MEQEDDRDSVGPTGTKNFSHSNTPVSAPLEAEAEAEAEAEGDAQYDARSSTTVAKKKPLRPNTAVPLQPKALTKLNLMKEAELKEALKKEYTQIQEAVKATEFVLPFVFFDGKNVPGGRVRLTKGHHIWMFLERARKVGAVLGRGHRGRKDWARISVDDLMFVRADLIIPHVSSSLLHDHFNASIGSLYANWPHPALHLPLLSHQQIARLSWPPIQ